MRSRPYFALSAANFRPNRCDREFFNTPNKSSTIFNTLTGVHAPPGECKVNGTLKDTLTVVILEQRLCTEAQDVVQFLLCHARRL